MNKYEFDIKNECIEHLPNNESYLKKVVIDKDDKFNALFVTVDEEKHVTEELLKFENTPRNCDMIVQEKYATVISLLEYYNRSVYDRIMREDVKLDILKVKYQFYRISSLICPAGCISLGYAIVNYNNDIETMIPAMLSSLGIIFVGMLSQYEYAKDKYLYEEKLLKLFDYIDGNSKKFIRIKK